jgi:hypothetical protein
MYYEMTDCYLRLYEQYFNNSHNEKKSTYSHSGSRYKITQENESSNFKIIRYFKFYFLFLLWLASSIKKFTTI